MQARDFAFHAWRLPLVCCLVAGCHGVPSQSGLLERDSSDARLSSHQLRVMVDEFVVHFAGRVELTADQILASTSDPTIRKNALLWKINGLAACFQAAARPDPLAAYLDIWILNHQMTQLFESPTQGPLFGPGQAIARAECHSLERRLKNINTAIGGELRLGEGFVTKFATDFPITSLYFDREPIVTRYIEEVREPARELPQVVANLDDSFEDLKQLSIIYAKHLPKQARWEAELFLIDSMQLDVVRRPLEDLSRTVEAVSRVADVTEAMPSLLERERHALHQIVVGERQQTLGALDRMKVDSLAQLEDERSLVLSALRDERKTVLAALRDERIAVSGDLRKETSKVLQATDAITRRRTEELMQQAPHVVDHFFWRLWQLCLSFVLAAAAIFWLHRRKRKQVSPAPVTLAVPGSAGEHLALYDRAERQNAA